jgi:hypothetical protein
LTWVFVSRSKKKFARIVFFERPPPKIQKKKPQKMAEEKLKERVRALDKWKDEPVEPTEPEKKQIRRRSNPASDAENRLGFMKASRTWERALQTIPRMMRKLESKIAEAERHVREGNDDEAEKIRWEVYTECLDFENRLELSLDALKTASVMRSAAPLLSRPTRLGTQSLTASAEDGTEQKAVDLLAYLQLRADFIERIDDPTETAADVVPNQLDVQEALHELTKDAKPDVFDSVMIRRRAMLQKATQLASELRTFVPPADRDERKWAEFHQRLEEHSAKIEKELTGIKTIKDTIVEARATLLRDKARLIAVERLCAEHKPSPQKSRRRK